MPRRPSRTVLHHSRVASLRTSLEALEASTDAGGRVSQDPLHFVKRWDQLEDIEVAGVFVSGLAYGRVSAFWPVLQALEQRWEAHGGPRSWVEHFDAEEALAIEPIVYRWMRGPDLAIMARTLGSFLGRQGLGQAFEAASRRSQPNVGPALDVVVGALRQEACAVEGKAWSELPRGFRYFLPQPKDGSACKRWNMFLRWLVRPPGEGPAGVDLGLWSLDPAKLVIPLDTHVLRLSRYLGLTRRPEGSWRTAVEITANLARLDPADPVRFDFALAHLGISGGCQSAYVPEVCEACGLRPVCRVAEAGAPARAQP